MIDLLLAAAALQAQAPVSPVSPASAPAEEAGEAIVVVGTRRGRCRLQLAGRALSDREFAAVSREWGALGRPVSVVHPAGADYRCLARIAFRLQDQGVRLVHFVEAGAPPRR